MATPAEQEELLRRVQLEPSQKGDIRKGGDGDKDADHVGDVVGPQRIGAGDARDQQARPGEGIQKEHVYLHMLNQIGDHLVEQRGKDPPREPG